LWVLGRRGVVVGLLVAWDMEFVLVGTSKE
jgi:hypothetical protein